MLNVQWFMRRRSEDKWLTGYTDMPTARHAIGGAVVGGKIYAIGGNTLSDSSSNKNECYDPATDTWAVKTDMSVERTYPYTAAVGGKIHVMGGSLLADMRQDHYIYDVAGNSWTTGANFPRKSTYSNNSAVTLDGKIYCIGGFYYPSSNSPYNDLYDPATDTWAAKTDIPTARRHNGVQTVGGKIYSIGGQSSSTSKKNECYDPSANTWSTKTDMPTAKTAFGSEVVDGVIYCIGDKAQNNEAYDPATDTWTAKTDIPSDRWFTLAKQVGGIIYVIGGYTDATHAHKTVEAYVP